MKIVAKLLVSVLLLCVSLAAQNGSPFVWEGSKGSVRFYLYGTIHLPDPQLKLPWNVKRLIARSRGGVYTEVPMTLQTQRSAARAMQRRDTRSLRRLLGDRLYRRTQNYLKRLDPPVDISRFGGLKVWALATQLSSLQNQLRYPLLLPLDTQVYRYAKAKGIHAGGIETVDEQLEIFDRFSLDEQRLMLEGTLDELEKTHDASQKLVKLYLDGDAKALRRYFQYTLFHVPRYRQVESVFLERLLYRRNVRMAERIEARLRQCGDAPCFFAFGAMHFLGEKSVIELLKKRGYRIVRIGFTDSGLRP